jgi:NAD(P)-dependent dehydrogenase (short-subunit alcohol dehydrogenase family)
MLNRHLLLSIHSTATDSEAAMAGKVVLITGASRGIGAGVARRLASEGETLALVGLEPDELKKVAEDCGPDSGWWEADVTDTESLRTTCTACGAPCT